MTGFNTMKRSTLVSLIAISLCFVLMLGATWAWFSSTVTNQGNTIAVGTFELDVLVGGASIDNTADGSAVLPVFDEENWAPGSTITKVFTVKNMGTIPMNWEAKLETGENAVDAALAAKINVTVKQGTQEDTYTLAQLLGGQTLVTGAAALGATESAEITVTVAMADNAGNDLMGKTLGFDIEITADQAQ